jgi:hypothetical protein
MGYGQELRDPVCQEKEAMKRSWFKPWGWIYRPVSWQGVVITLLGVLFSMQVFLVVDARSHSVSDTLYGIFPYFVCCWLLVYWIAANTSAHQD